MQRLFIILSLSIGVYSKEIISEFEYGQMLYNNPRGVSCMACHAPKGEGRVIVSYFDKGEKVVLYTKSIINKSFKEYKLATKNGPKIMPKYFLTDKELIAIYRYIKEANRKVKDENSSNNSITNIGDSSQNSNSNQTAFGGSISELE